jgi:hypothetical protein
MRIAIILVVAALLLAGCNPNQERESACRPWRSSPRLRFDHASIGGHVTPRPR